MSNITGTVRSRNVIEFGSDPIVYNVSVPLANTEVSQALNASTKRFTIRVRGTSKMQLAFAAGTSGTVFITLPAGTTYTEDGINFTGTLYFQTEKASQVVEILEWS